MAATITPPGKARIMSCPECRGQTGLDCAECGGDGRILIRACPLCGDNGWDYVNGVDDDQGMACRISCGYRWTADDPGVAFAGAPQPASMTPQPVTTGWMRRCRRVTGTGLAGAGLRTRSRVGTLPSRRPAGQSRRLARGGVGATTERVERSIRDLIASGQLGPGGRLPSERQFAEQLNAGRTTVRLILTKLTAECMIRSEHGRGYFVTGADSKSAETVE